MSSPESALLPRDTDFGYEVIDKPDKGQEGDDEDASSVSIADHYRGTPPLKGKKKKPHHKPNSRSESVNETPPPLPPKKRDSQQPDREASVDSTTSSIQSRPLPTPPTPRIQRNPAPAIEDTDNDLDEEQFHSLRSTTTLNPAAEDQTSEKFHSLKSGPSLTLLADQAQDQEPVDETLAESIIDSMHTCVDTLNSDTMKDADPVANQSHENTLNVPGISDEENDDEYMAEMLPHDNLNESPAQTPTT